MNEWNLISRQDNTILNQNTSWPMVSIFKFHAPIFDIGKITFRDFLFVVFEIEKYQFFYI